MEYKETDIQLTQQLEAKNKKKKRNWKKLLISLGSVALVAGASYGLMISISAAKNAGK
ncbi:MAG: hypothetical protein KAG91_01580 [Mycoplasmataceae bacterium]|nr:hypothetical protein [Mycoplasmataceae bacterium]